MATPRSLVYTLYTHWDTVELLVRLSREFAVLTSDQVLNGIAKASGQRDAEAQGVVLRALVNADILQTLPRSSDLQLNAYVLEFVDEAASEDLVFESFGIKVIIDPKSLAYLDGTELDFVKEGLNEGFKFNNPNVRGECGCGESFTTDDMHR